MKESSDILLSLKNITKNFKSVDSSLTVLKNLSIDINRGEFVSILGPSGCGKSTLLKICSSIIKQDAGEVCVSNVIVNHPDRTRILMLQDDNQLFPWLTVKSNISFAEEFLELKRRESKVPKLLELAGLSEYSDYYPHQLSGGMKKRTALARAFAGNPEILLMDEPFGSLDAKLKIKLQKFLLEIWNKYRMTILFVTHDIDEALRLGRRIIIMNDSGDIICDEKNTLPRVGDFSEDEFFKLYRKYYSLLTGSISL